MVNIPGTKEETATVGIEGLGERCAKYYAAGARFAKWYDCTIYTIFVVHVDSLRIRRAALKISATEPSETAIMENARGLALYAAICQVPTMKYEDS